MVVSDPRADVTEDVFDQPAGRPGHQRRQQPVSAKRPTDRAGRFCRELGDPDRPTLSKLFFRASRWIGAGHPEEVGKIAAALGEKVAHLDEIASRFGEMVSEPPVCRHAAMILSARK